MARSHNTDPLFTSDFALLDISLNIVAETAAGQGVPVPFAFPIKQALQIANEGISFISFAGISLPQVTLGTRQIEELAYPFSRTVLTGNAEVSEVTLRQACVPTGIDFYFWLYQALKGIGGPRRNFYVLHLDKSKKKIRRTYFLEGCIPTGWTPSGDLDATSGEVSIEEIVFSVERVELDIADPT